VGTPDAEPRMNNSPDVTFTLDLTLKEDPPLENTQDILTALAFKIVG
jgi:hypothetical protein